MSAADTSAPAGPHPPPDAHAPPDVPGAPAAAPAHDIEIDLQARTPGMPPASRLRDWIRLALGEAPAPVSVGVLVVGETRARGFNRDYRGRDYATNVLSFPAEVIAPLPVRPLGDLVVCAPVVATQAREAGIEEAAHWAHMVIHGMLHLLGYDHENDDDAAVMEAREAELLAVAGFADPYQHTR